MIQPFLTRAGCAALLCLPLTVSGVSYTYLDVYVRGEIYSAPCKINKGKNILVDFKDVVTTHIENDNYSEKLDYRIECQDNRPRGIKMYISGTPSSLDARFLSTSVGGLAVKFQADNALMELGKGINIQSQAQPEIRVILAKKSGVKLPSGDFNANATIHIEYE